MERAGVLQNPKKVEKTQQEINSEIYLLFWTRFHDKWGYPSMEYIEKEAEKVL